MAWGGEHIEPRFIEAGFVDVEVKKYRINIGDWSEGKFNQGLR
jgi:hypothetical protein